MARYSERWLTDGSGVPTGWTNDIYAGATFSGSVSNNSLINNTATLASFIKYDAADAFTNTDQVTTFSMTATLADFYNQANTFGPGMIARFSGSNGTSDRAGYLCHLHSDGTFKISKYVANVNTFLNSSSSLTALGIVAETELNQILICMRFQCAGTTIRAKVWRYGEAEPGSWTVSATDSSIAVAGKHGLYKPSSVTSTTSHAYHITDDAATASLDTVSGIITENGAPVARTVRLVQRNTGLIAASTTSNGVSGAYSASTPYGGEHILVTLDSSTSAPIRNDAVHRVFPA